MTNPMRKAWAKAIDEPAKEFELTELKIISGRIPEGLRGSLYRNGPARLQRGDKKVGHWFDGDGAILGIHFDSSGAQGVYRYVKTAEYLEEEKANRFIYGGYNMKPKKIFGAGAKNASNTSVLAIDGKLLSLWEGGHPYSLDLRTLETNGIDDLGELRANQPFSAHPKRDFKSGEIYNFGISYGKTSELNLYCLNTKGKIKRQNSLKLDFPTMIHDFVLAGQYLIFFISPLNLELIPFLTGLKTYSASLKWQPQRGTQIMIIDRETFEIVSKGEAEAWYQWHFSNGYVDERGAININFVKYADFQTNQYLQEYPHGFTKTKAPGYFSSICLNPENGKILKTEKLFEETCEFPTVSPFEVGQRAKASYLSLRSSKNDIGEELFDTIACFNHEKNELSQMRAGDNNYVSEPIYAPDKNDSAKGWVLSLIYNGENHRSEAWILAADAVEDGAIAKIELPEVIPPGFHGTWREN